MWWNTAGPANTTSRQMACRPSGSCRAAMHVSLWRPDFGGNGMPFGSLSAAIITDLIVRGERRYEKLFNPSRFKPSAGFSSFVKENATVVHDMVADKLSMEPIKSLSDIPA